MECSDLIPSRDQVEGTIVTGARGGGGARFDPVTGRDSTPSPGANDAPPRPPTLPEGTIVTARRVADDWAARAEDWWLGRCRRR